jgi:hypothetical protein
MLGPVGRVASGLAAGCAGIVALEIASYVDQYRRARPASKTPTKLGKQVAERAGVDLGTGAEGTNRASALGPLVGYVDGLALGVVAATMSATPGRSIVRTAAILTAGAWLGSNGPLMALGLTDPAKWTAEEWTSDLVPHAAYGITTAATIALLR